MKEQVLQVLSQYKFPLIVGIIGLMFFGYGLISLLSHEEKSEDITFVAGAESDASVKNTITVKTEVFIDVAGGVLSPGVYTLPEDARVQDALVAAGGMSEDADRELVAKQLNLAAKVKDGTKIYVPKIGESTKNIVESVEGESGSSLVNINTASQSELESLPGIGPVTAVKIMDNRPYGSIEELTEKKVVNSSVFEKIKDTIGTY